jgi:hypothetical protein
VKLPLAWLAQTCLSMSAAPISPGERGLPQAGSLRQPPDGRARRASSRFRSCQAGWRRASAALRLCANQASCFMVTRDESFRLTIGRRAWVIRRARPPCASHRSLDDPHIGACLHLLRTSRTLAPPRCEKPGSADAGSEEVVAIGFRLGTGLLGDAGASALAELFP